MFLQSPPSPRSSLFFLAPFNAVSSAAIAAAAASAVHSPPRSAPIVCPGSIPGASTTTTTTFSASMPALTHRVPDRSLTHSVSPPSRDARTSIGTAAAFAPWPMRPANGVCSCPPRMTAISGTCQKTKHDVSRIARAVRK